jgi:hypothetical protein
MRVLLDDCVQRKLKGKARLKNAGKLVTHANGVPQALKRGPISST